MVKLIERLLIEDIEAVRKQYSYIPTEDFDRIIRLDPTFNEERDSVGKYGKWLLGLYKKDKENLNSSLPDIIAQYDFLKNDRRYNVEKDIMRFKSVQDMQSAIDNATENELSKKQSNRQAKKDNPYNIVFDGDIYMIFVPENHNGNMVLASFGNSRKARWCTAADSANGIEMYDFYLKRGGKYYVLIDKQDYDNKYQFHFESNQFKDSFNEEIDLEDFMERNPDIKEFFEKEGYDLSKYGQVVPEDPYEQIDMITNYLSQVDMFYVIRRQFVFDIMDSKGFMDSFIEEEADRFCCEDKEEQFNRLHSRNIGLGMPYNYDGKIYYTFSDFDINDGADFALSVLGGEDFDDWGIDWAEDKWYGCKSDDVYYEWYGRLLNAANLEEFAEDWVKPHDAAKYIVNDLDMGYAWCEDIMNYN